ncbi:MAG: TonB-dependent receptor [Chlorogloeopsis fritschii C42_A2020_084]|uniref:MFS transporter n=1 Tax=Chlorogloeopsis fritschii TaxID=1124 RepID=UPI0019F13490|nr:TonB-dependent receptor [Chlorogloeopsis fritschii C42_A2020_084]
MTLEQQPKSLRTFTVIWLGQTASLIGSNMTSFALTIWAWQQTGEATPLSLIAFFTEVPILIASIFAGVLVDRYNRKFIMIGGDTVAALSTVIVLILFFTNQLAIWHLYIIGAANGLFGYFHGLAFSASQALLVSQQHYVRVGAMGSIRTFGSGVIAPALAGVLYPLVGLIGILLIDIATFAIAVSTLWIFPARSTLVELQNNLKLLIGGRFDSVSSKENFGDEVTSDNQAFSPRVGIVYQPIPAVSLYASYSQSFTPQFGRSADNSAFKPERGTQSTSCTNSVSMKKYRSKKKEQ